MKFRIVAEVPSRSSIPMSLSLPSVVSGSPIRVRLYSVGLERGVRLLLSPLLSASMPWSASSPLCMTMMNCPLPVQPSVQSILSSAMACSTTCFTATVPPKNSRPSSLLYFTMTWSTSVRLPTPWKEIPFSSLSGLNSVPANSTRT